jgi:hypothetical protein
MKEQTMKKNVGKKSSNKKNLLSPSMKKRENINLFSSN